MPIGRISHRTVSRIGWLVPGLAMLLILPGRALSQAPTHGTDPTYTTPNAGSTSSEGMTGPFGRVDPVVEARRRQAQIAEIRQSMESDAARLLKLAQELDDEVSRTNPDVLTPAQLKMVAEIQKLAHRVKAKMNEIDRGTATEPPLPITVPQHQ